MLMKAYKDKKKGVKFGKDGKWYPSREECLDAQNGKGFKKTEPIKEDSKSK